MKKILCIIFLAMFVICASAQRWQISSDQGIVWTPKNDLPHSDHIEMSGEQTSLVLRWGVDDKGAFQLERSLVFPMLRVLPNDTHASLMSRLATDFISMLTINTSAIGVNSSALQVEKVQTVTIDGTLNVKSLWAFNSVGAGAEFSENPTPIIEMTRVIFPSRTLPLVWEQYTIKNIGSKPFEIGIPNFTQSITTDPNKSPTKRAYVLRADINGSGNFYLQPNETITFNAVMEAYNEGEKPQEPSVEGEYAARMDFVKKI